MELPDVYRTNAAELVRVIGSLGDDRVTAPVPACPGWTVHDVLAHQAGSSTDLVAGQVDGVATPPWTSRQIEERRDRTVAELVAEWSANVETVASSCRTPTPNPAWDVCVHLDDVREALGLAPVAAEEGWGDVLAAALRFLGSRAGVSVSVAERGPDPGTTTWHVATAYGLWRGVFSRLDRTALAREVLRGDVDAFARTAFFAP